MSEDQQKKGAGSVWPGRAWGAIKPAAFVVVTLVTWYVFLALARIVVTCQPGGDPCRAPDVIRQGLKWVWPEAADTASLGAFSKEYLYGAPGVDAMFAVVLLCFAVWQGVRLVFPNKVELPPMKAAPAEPKTLGPRPVEKSA